MAVVVAVEGAGIAEARLCRVVEPLPTHAVSGLILAVLICDCVAATRKSMADTAVVVAVVDGVFDLPVPCEVPFFLLRLFLALVGGFSRRIPGAIDRDDDEDDDDVEIAIERC